jgi:uncharacterized protein (DUF2345 family)
VTDFGSHPFRFLDAAISRATEARGRDRLYRSAVLSAALLGVLVAAGAAPQIFAARRARPVVLRAQVDGSFLTIEGTDLSDELTPPRVWLGPDELNVSSHAAQLVVADLPPGIAPGDYLLRVATDRLRIDRFVVSLRDAARLVTPEGIVIESTGAEVRIAASDSVITLDGAGNVTIQAAADLNLVAGAALNIRGNSVNVQSDTATSLVSGSGMALSSGSGMALSSGSGMTLTTGLDLAVQSGRGTTIDAAQQMVLQFGTVMSVSGETVNTNVSRDWRVSAGRDIDIQAAGTVTIKGSRIVTN